MASSSELQEVMKMEGRGRLTSRTWRAKPTASPADSGPEQARTASNSHSARSSKARAKWQTGVTSAHKLNCAKSSGGESAGETSRIRFASTESSPNHLLAAF